MTQTLPRRQELAAEHTWNLAAIFADDAAWEAAYGAIEARLPAVAAFAGHLGDSAGRLRDWIAFAEELGAALSRLLVYATHAYDSDTTDQAAAARRDRAFGLYARAQAATAFADPELLSIDPARIAAFLDEEPAIQPYAHYLANIQRLRPHVRSAEVEQVMALAGEPVSTAWTTYMALAEADLRFGEARGADGQPAPVSRGTIDELLLSRDRELRRSAWASYADGFLAFQNTLAASLAGQVKANIFSARVHHHPSALASALSGHQVPEPVYHAVIAACRRHLPLWHRYWEVRRRALGLERLEACDIFAPLASPPPVPYEQAVDWICAGLDPLGPAYIDVARRGLTHERWVDRYPSQGKIGGAYSGGTHGTPPFILMNYSDDLVSMSTLAHELGHSMHSYLTNQTQPFVYSQYSMFVAEVASNFNQALLRHHLLGQPLERDTRIGLLEEAMANFHRYLFVMPILAQFELQIYRTVEEGGALTAGAMNAILAELFREGYGPAVDVDPQRDGIVWAQFPHLYANFYVFQYASGIAAANALAAGVAAGSDDAARRYLEFLSLGSSRYPIDALRHAGIDMADPAQMDRAFQVLEGHIAELERLLA